MNNEKISKIFKVLSHPLRLKIIFGLINGDNCHVTKIAQNLKLPQSQISQHISILKSPGIIEGLRAGNEICYKVENSMVLKIIEILEIEK